MVHQSTGLSDRDQTPRNFWDPYPLSVCPIGSWALVSGGMEEFILFNYKQGNEKGVKESLKWVEERVLMAWSVAGVSCIFFGFVFGITAKDVEEVESKQDF